MEPAARLSAVTTGEIDLTVDVPFDSLTDLEANPDVMMKQEPSAHVWFVVLNTQISDSPFDNVLVRQAMNHAVDKEGIVRDILQGTAHQRSFRKAPALPQGAGIDCRRCAMDIY